MLKRGITNLEIQFKVKGQNECESFKTTFKGKQTVTDLIGLQSDVSNKKYIYALGTAKIYEPEGNVLCAKEVDVEWLLLKYDFE